MKTMIALLAHTVWALSWPFRVLMGAYMKMTYRHRDVPDLFEQITNTRYGEKARVIVVAREGVTIGWLVPRSAPPYLRADMPFTARWRPIAFTLNRKPQRLPASMWRRMALRRLEKFSEMSRERRTS